MRHGRAKEIGRRLAKDKRAPSGRVFEAADEAADIQAELSIGVLEGAVRGERKEFRALFEQSKGLVEPGIAELIVGIPDNDSAPAPRSEIGEVLLQGGAGHEKKGRDRALRDRFSRRAQG